MLSVEGWTVVRHRRFPACIQVLERNELNQKRAVMPAHAGIQYVAAPAIQLLTLWNTGSPHSRG
jgi:hypothetical protein